MADHQEQKNVNQVDAAKSFGEKFLSTIAIGLVLAPALASILSVALLPILLFNPFTFPLAILLGALLVLLTFLSVEYNSTLGKLVSKFILQNAIKHFSVKIVGEDLAAFNSKRSYVLGGEPHSILPLAYISLLENSNLFPLKNIRFMVGSTAMSSPFVKQIWTWLGCMPASREVIHKLLRNGTSVIVIPGGVQECLQMKPGREVVFLKKRLGFVRIAIQEGSPLVPVFIFNQTKLFSYKKLGHGPLFNKLSRKIGVAPICIWGEYLTIIPKRKPLYVAVGKPIEVKKNENPSNEEIVEAHEKFLKAFEELFEKHKEAAGNKDTILEII